MKRSKITNVIIGLLHISYASLCLGNNNINSGTKISRRYICRIEFNEIIPDTFLITNPNKDTHLALIKIKVGNNYWWLLNSSEKPKTGSVVAWNYNIALRILRLQTLEGIKTNSIEFVFILNVEEEIEIENFKCTIIDAENNNNKIFTTCKLREIL